MTACRSPLPPWWTAFETWRAHGGIPADRPTARLPKDKRGRVMIPAWAWECYRERHPKTPMSVRLEPAVWRQAGIWVTTPGNFNADRRVHAVANGFRWVAESPDGVGSVAWIVGSANPVTDSDTALSAIKRGASAIIANNETVYESYYRDRSAFFLDGFRARCPGTPLLLAGNGYGGEGGVRDFDYASWIAAGASFAPEAYANVHPELTVRNCVLHALRAGWPKARIHPMLGTYDSDAERAKITPDIVAQYVADMDDYGITGFSIYVGDQTPAWVIEQLGQAIRDLRLAS